MRGAEHDYRLAVDDEGKAVVYVDGWAVLEVDAWGAENLSNGRRSIRLAVTPLLVRGGLIADVEVGRVALIDEDDVPAAVTS